MITGDLVRHLADKSSFGVVMKVDISEAKILWLDKDNPLVAYYPQSDLEVTSSADLDWQDNVLTLKV